MLLDPRSDELIFGQKTCLTPCVSLLVQQTKQVILIVVAVVGGGPLLVNRCLRFCS